MLSTRRAATIALLATVLHATSTHALFFPGIDRPTSKELAEEERVGYWKNLPNRLKKVFLTPVYGVAANLDYHYGTQDFVSTVSGFPSFDNQSELNTYSIRPEFVWTNWLSTYAVGALHRGTNTSDITNLDLDGWGAGLGIATALGLPQYTVKSREVTFDPLFIVPDFNWTHNEFADIDNAVNVYNVTTRIGAGMRTTRYNWGLYAGPMYQYSTKDLQLQFAGMQFTANTEPRNAWSGVVGAYFGYIYTDKVAPETREETAREGPDDINRPTLLLTVEGGVGNRQGVLVSLRYEYDFYKK